VINDTTYLAFNKKEAIYLYNSLIERDHYYQTIKDYEILTKMLEKKNKMMVERDSIYNEYIIEIKKDEKKKRKKQKFIGVGIGYIAGILTVLILL